MGVKFAVPRSPVPGTAPNDLGLKLLSLVPRFYIRRRVYLPAAWCLRLKPWAARTVVGPTRGYIEINWRGV